MPPSPLLLSKGRGGEIGLTTVAQGEGNWGPPPLLATPEELANLGLGYCLLEYGLVLEACSSHTSPWDAFRGEQASRGKSREHDLGTQRTHAMCGSNIDITTPHTPHFVCPLGATDLGDTEDTSCNDLQK